MEPSPRPRDPVEVPDDATALVVLVPEADAVVGALRTAHDPASLNGMPAHVTVLFPFVTEQEWQYLAGDERPDERLARVLGTLPTFEARFERTARFGTTTLYLVPEPSASFTKLLAAVAAEFPAWPPYGGAYAEIVPHLTIADRSTSDVLDRCDAEVAGALPITTDVADVALFGKREGRWTLLQRWPFDFPQRGPVIGLFGPGAEMQLSVVSYQFGVSDASSADWLVVLCGVRADGHQEWHRGACLEASDLPRLADFLDAAADGPRPGLSCTFTEPNLAFVCAGGDETDVRIRAGFAPEWALPGVEPTDPHPVGGMPCTWADFEATPEQLRAEAAVARELARLWPSRKHLFQRKASAKSLRKAQRRDARRRAPGPPPPSPPV